MDRRLRHRQTKGTVTVEASLRSPRHISTPQVSLSHDDHWLSGFNVECCRIPKLVRARVHRLRNFQKRSTFLTQVIRRIAGRALKLEGRELIGRPRFDRNGIQAQHRCTLWPARDSNVHVEIMQYIRREELHFIGRYAIRTETNECDGELCRLRRLAFLLFRPVSPVTGYFVRKDPNGQRLVAGVRGIEIIEIAHRTRIQRWRSNLRHRSFGHQCLLMKCAASPSATAAVSMPPTSL